MFNPTSLIGKQIDRFRLDQFIAKGATGMVFKAFDTALNRTVALKLISTKTDPNSTSEENAAREEALKRLGQEAMYTSGLTHPNVVTIHSHGETDEYGYICMEYAPGRTLADILTEKKRLTPEEALPLFVQVLLALEATHQQQLVHRDIKPSHIVIAEDGRVRVIDFGPASLNVLPTARTKAVPGAICYMSPERISGKEVDIRSDIFSLGAVLFEVISGEKPLQGANSASLEHQILKSRSTPSQALAPPVPAALRGIIKKCMAEDPAMRYGTPGEMIRDLRIAMRVYQRPELEVADALTVAAAYMEGKTVIARPASKSKTSHGPSPAPAMVNDSESQEPVTVLATPVARGPAKAKVAAPSDMREASAPKPHETEHAAVPPSKEAAGQDKVQEIAQGAPPAPAPPEAKPSDKAGAAQTVHLIDAKHRPQAKASGMRVGWIGALLLVIVIGALTLFFRQKLVSTSPEDAPAPATGSSSVSLSVKDAASPASLALQAKDEMSSNPTAARRLLEEALAREPDNFDAIVQLGRLLAESKDYSAALQQYQHALRLDNKSAEVYFALGSLHQNRGEYDSAIENFEFCWALAPSNQDEVVANLGMSYMKKGNRNQAQVLFRQALDLNPNNLLARSYLELPVESVPQTAATTPGLTSPKTATRGSSPVPDTTQPGKLDGKQPQGSPQPSAGFSMPGPAPGPAQASPESLVLLAKDSMESDPARAKKLLQDALVLDPKNFEAMLQLGRLYTFQKDFGAAIKHYQSALRVDNRSALAYFNLGYIHMMQGNYDLAISSYSSCLALNPVYKDEALTNLGLCYLKKNNPTQAKLQFQEALRLNPRNSVATRYLQAATKSAAQP
jgi:eukaryotic-like serine/threonine-protein kinase